MKNLNGKLWSIEKAFLENGRDGEYLVLLVTIAGRAIFYNINTPADLTEVIKRVHRHVGQVTRQPHSADYHDIERQVRQIINASRALTYWFQGAVFRNR